MLRALPLLRRAGLSRRAFASALDRRVLDSFATTDPTALSGRDPYIVDNLREYPCCLACSLVPADQACMCGCYCMQ